jgi:5'-3' exonuclease
LRCQYCEGDDFIARWIQRHPDDHHVIVSTDSDYKQLLAPNVEMYDGVRNQLYTLQGIFHKSGSVFKKTADNEKLHNEFWKVKILAEEDPYCVDPAWALISKMMIGDTSDNITRAMPPRSGVKKLQKIWQDVDAWAELMQVIREDLPDKPTVQKILDRNYELVCLDAQPQEIIDVMDTVIDEQANRERRKNVILKFMDFCEAQNLPNLALDYKFYVPMLSAWNSHK